MKLRIYHLSLEVMADLVEMGFLGYHVIEIHKETISIEIEPSYGERVEGVWKFEIDFNTRVKITHQIIRGRKFEVFEIHPNEFGSIEII